MLVEVVDMLVELKDWINQKIAPNQSGVNVDGMSAKCLTMIPQRFAIEWLIVVGYLEIQLYGTSQRVNTKTELWKFLKEEVYL